ncbi:MAG TPA: hypothetical protein PK537_10920 [Candidatus Limiplasma sp.]|nr:hypothetical protein [Candidatus Limiplasma sp.]
MKRGLALLILIPLLFSATGACALVERNMLLDVAFEMLEEGNPILERYNEITGADVQARYELGLPYFFGGKDPDRLMTIGHAVETMKIYIEGDRYIYGFDCTGYMDWINLETGRPKNDTLEYMITKYVDYKDNQLPINDVPYAELKNYLEVGDYLVTKVNRRHIMMYIGTLADYGYTAEEVPELADYLEYPLLIHCGKNPTYGDRYAEYIEENNLNCNTTNGGVSITIVGMPVEGVPHFIHAYKSDHYYFDLNGYMLVVQDMSVTTSHVWFRVL